MAITVAVTVIARAAGVGVIFGSGRGWRGFGLLRRRCFMARFGLRGGSSARGGVLVVLEAVFAGNAGAVIAIEFANVGFGLGWFGFIVSGLSGFRRGMF